jgi:hypothetical protein
MSNERELFRQIMFLAIEALFAATSILEPIDLRLRLETVVVVQENHPGHA